VFTYDTNIRRNERGGVSNTRNIMRKIDTRMANVDPVGTKLSEPYLNEVEGLEKKAYTIIKPALLSIQINRTG